MMLPPAIAWPFTAATVGFGKANRRSNSRDIVAPAVAMYSLPSSRTRNRSAPAEKTLFSPVTISARASDASTSSSSTMVTCMNSRSSAFAGGFDSRRTASSSVRSITDGTVRGRPVRWRINGIGWADGRSETPNQGGAGHVRVDLHRTLEEAELAVQRRTGVAPRGHQTPAQTQRRTRRQGHRFDREAGIPRAARRRRERGRRVPHPRWPAPLLGRAAAGAEAVAGRDRPDGPRAPDARPQRREGAEHP